LGGHALTGFRLKLARCGKESFDRAKFLDSPAPLM